MAPQVLTILGSTGSIGVSTLDVVARHPERFKVFALCAHRQVDRLFDQCQAFRPRFAVLGEAKLAVELSRRLREQGSSTEVLHGEEALASVASASEVSIVMAAIVGAAGLKPTLAAAHAGKKILLANKEVLVMAGELFMEAARNHGARILPVDSEHNAIFQALPRDFSDDLGSEGIRRILLTASGGPFRTTPRAALADITPEQACAHPNWVMGRKISVDSATMMNKGLEVIEARWLFNLSAEKIDVVVHPQSVVHSMVEYADGSVLAQMGNPDMRTPIAYCLAYPERIDAGVSSLDLFKVGRLDFEAPDFERFPCLRLAYAAIAAGGTAPAILNAANEIAVEAFLDRKLGFLGISHLIEAVMAALPARPEGSLDEVLTADRAARELAHQLLQDQKVFS